MQSYILADILSPLLSLQSMNSFYLQSSLNKQNNILAETLYLLLLLQSTNSFNQNYGTFAYQWFDSLNKANHYYIF